ncbi:2-keto-3-deoxy-L-rhamnonate aldolase RhmA [Paraburkholderia tropica]|uniref:2-keto-3-deoxy-L-rhamnonate aldolase RhmA n=1 Tax=Paraburkholderia tropica TaxID=92647 RepID=A0AAQ1GPC7_9BURK|nr:aldolase/citrate lyase family protein [Paraburkholderia tropica]MBB3005049.1 2-keto-3-deoxy-L-rhamnonate aldolase RhmA [Paraburkholderia tropica]MBB6324014.1 2-keto-3-deoxy-L-rhamnonate aldolase RhmA [Paraburkholderia tropica]QNB17342.1 aldolase [Paraburkholderia tropica]RQN34176.1 aldolase [Paraburkholderia tropica]SEK15208.1 2-keto-3-deoxy-L-rhamnonate aldolase RhmA [Paraburkholderia tropica]
MSALTFRQRLRSGAVIVSSFIKTGHYQPVEVAGAAGLDAVVIDAEHAAFGAGELDACLMACRAAGVAGLVRVPDTQAATLLRVLDMGADGVLVPHVRNAAQAAEIVARTRYAQGVRGFSNSARAGDYGVTPMGEHIARQDENICVICQIEDEDALAHLDAIAAVDGVDCLFVGRADLSVSLGTFDLDAPAVAHATRAALGAAVDAGKTGGIFLGETTTVPEWRAAGASFFVIGSDQSMMRAGWRQAAQHVRAAL